jgi:hypothetical protein
MRELDNIPVPEPAQVTIRLVISCPKPELPIVRVGETIWTQPPFSVMAFHIGLVHFD